MAIRLLIGVLLCAKLVGCAHVHGEDEAWASDAGWSAGDAGLDASDRIQRGDRAAADPAEQDRPPIARLDDLPVTAIGEPDASRDDEQPAAADAGPAPEPSARDAAVGGFPPLTVVSEVSSPYATPDDEIVILWQILLPTQQYHPARAVIEGDLERFRVVLPAEPPVDGRHAVEDPQTGDTPPGATRIASAAIYRVVAGKLDANPEGVNALDVDIVIGQTDGSIFWTPVDLPAGWAAGRSALSAGYHLFLNGVEVDLGTQLTLRNEIWD